MEFLKVWVIMENEVIWAVLHLQTKDRKQGKAAHNQETFPRKMVKFMLRKNMDYKNNNNIITYYYI